MSSTTIINELNNGIKIFLKYGCATGELWQGYCFEGKDRGF